MKGRILFIFLFILSQLSYGIEEKEKRIYGNSGYILDETRELVTTINGEYSVYLYQPDSELWVIVLGGKVVMDIDHLGNEVKTNVFTTLGLEF